MFKIPARYRLILASQSPRRQHLLRESGIVFEIAERDFDESFPEELKGKEIAEYLAQSKAEQLLKEFNDENTVVITADTIVWVKGKMLGKPHDYESAFGILKNISGCTHEVITGVGLLNGVRLKVFSESTLVTFDTLTDETIDYYIRNYKPYDKAGAYGIQDWIGIVGNTDINGSFFNVMGMPVNRLLRELENWLK